MKVKPGNQTHRTGLTNCMGRLQGTPCTTKDWPAQLGWVTLRKVALNWRGMQVAAGILYSQVPSVMRRPVSESVMTSSLVKRPSPWMKAPSTCRQKAYSFRTDS